MLTTSALDLLAANMLEVESLRKNNRGEALKAYIMVGVDSHGSAGKWISKEMSPVR